MPAQSQVNHPNDSINHDTNKPAETVGIVALLLPMTAEVSCGGDRNYV